MDEFLLLKPYSVCRQFGKVKKSFSTGFGSLLFTLQRMKSIPEIKNEVANQIGYNSWEDYMNEIRGTFYERERIEKAWEEVCYRYAQEESKRITVAQKLKKLLQELKIRTHDKRSKNVHGYL